MDVINKWYILENYKDNFDMLLIAKKQNHVSVIFI